MSFQVCFGLDNHEVLNDTLPNKEAAEILLSVSLHFCGFF